eukprot:3471898-Pyramimonas_sp.AAC.1
MTRGQLDALVAGTWGKSLPKLRGRAMALHLANMSPTKTALAWNTYLIALIPYPSHYSLPDT